MKIKAISSLRPAASKLAFGFACALIAGAGWAAKIGFDQLGAMSDKVSAALEDPAPDYLRARQRVVSSLLEAPTQSAPAIQLFLTNSSTPVVQ